MRISAILRKTQSIRTVRKKVQFGCLIILEYLKFRPKKAHTKRTSPKYQSIHTNQHGRKITVIVVLECLKLTIGESIIELCGLKTELLKPNMAA